jgi:NTE family protein
VVGAQVAAGQDVEQRYEAQLAPPDGEVAATLGPGLMARFAMAMVGPRAPQRVRARIGKLAVRAKTVPEATRVAVIESRMPVREWPDRRLLITAVDVATGEFKVFDKDSGVSLVLAVAASCAVPGVWPPVTIDGRRYMDGGVRSSANADLAAGYDRVIVIAPIARAMGPMAGVDTQIEALRALSQVCLVTPDKAALAAFGRNLLDPAKRAAAARAGLAQAGSVIDQVRETWAG